jgi:hypothetical protein
MHPGIGDAPNQTSYQPMEAELAAKLPKGPLWQYEPKRDGSGA